GLPPALADDKNKTVCLTEWFGSEKEQVRACTDALKTSKLTKAERARAHYMRGRIYDDRRNYDLAYADFDAAIRLDPRTGRYFNGHGRVALERKDYDRAIIDFNEVLKLDPDFFGVAYYGRG